MAKILIIEDDALISRMYKKALSFEGFEVAVARNGREGLEEAQRTSPELILLDIMMPKMNGLEVLQRLKADEKLKKIPVVVLTNLSGTQDAQKAKQLGAKDYLVKSEYKPKEIADKIKSMIGGSPQKEEGVGEAKE